MTLVREAEIAGDPGDRVRHGPSIARTCKTWRDDGWYKTIVRGTFDLMRATEVSRRGFLRAAGGTPVWFLETFKGGDG
jgi:hypothetical protein